MKAYFQTHTEPTKIIITNNETEKNICVFINSKEAMEDRDGSQIGSFSTQLPITIKG